MQKEEIKQKLSDKFLEVCRAGILLSSYGVPHILADDTLPYSIASKANEEICKGRSSSSDIIGVLDTTIRQNGSGGFAFTEDALYCNCFENRNSNFSIQYAEIDRIRYDNSDEDDIHLEIKRKHGGSSYQINVGAFSKKKIKQFLDYAVELYKEINNDELNWDKL